MTTLTEPPGELETEKNYQPKFLHLSDALYAYAPCDICGKWRRINQECRLHLCYPIRLILDLMGTDGAIIRRRLCMSETLYEAYLNVYGMKVVNEVMENTFGDDYHSPLAPFNALDQLRTIKPALDQMKAERDALTEDQ